MLEKLRMHWPKIKAKLFPYLARELDKRKNRP